LGTYSKHTKKITDISFIPGGDSKNLTAITCSEDAESHLIRFNLDSKEFTQAYVANQHSKAITSCAVHPIRSLYIIGSQDGSFSYHDSAQGKFLAKVSLSESGVTSMKVQPDGMIMAIGSGDGVVTLWNITEHLKMASITAGNGPVQKIAFSENGYSFATSILGESVVKIWDLRRLGEDNVKSIDNPNFKVGSVAFDNSGQIFAIGGTSLLLYDAKNYENFANFKSAKDIITGVRFGNNSKFIASASMDRNLNIFS